MNGKPYSERLYKGEYQLAWECPHESQQGKECLKLHWVNWDRKFDSCGDGIELYCENHWRQHVE